MRLGITHTTVYRYEPPANRIALRLRLYPSSFEGQDVTEWKVTVNGKVADRLLIDGYGDGVGLWHAYAPCEAAEIVATGVVETSDRAGVVRGLRRRPPAAMFLRPTALTEPNSAIRSLASRAQGDAPLDRMHALSKLIEAAITYDQAATDAKTTAAQALSKGAGVCQDYAHVMIAAARSIGIPARYVTGYMVADREDDGEGTELETHGWAEVFIDGIGWIGFDPSNGLCPTDRYVRLACGLDASAAAPIKGSVGGDTTVALEASVAIAPTSSQSQSQSQNEGDPSGSGQSQSQSQ